MTYTEYIRCLCATTSHDIVTLRVFHIRCCSCPTHIPRFMITGYRLLSYDCRIFDHICIILNSHCACAVSRGLCIGGPPKPHVTIFLPRIIYSLCNFYGATPAIKGSFTFEHPHVRAIFAKNCPVQIGPQNSGFSQI